MILIVSFNARIIASLAKKLGLEFAVVDFWGDQDLFPLSERVYTIFKSEFKSYAEFPSPEENEDKLAQLALDVISNEGIEGILIGSGLDNRPDLWAKLGEAAPILGNDPAYVQRARDLLYVHLILASYKIKFPFTIWSNRISDILNFAKRIQFPVVIKPKKTLGGVGILLIKNEWELKEFCEENSAKLRNYFFQQYIEGKDISTTMVGDGKRYRMLSINEQLIGLESSGTNSVFKYCGNILPFICDSKVARKIQEDSIMISKALRLSGVFGIDFVLQGDIPYFMEINPRFPGTVELLEMASKLNAVEMHLNAIRGEIPTTTVNFGGFAMKQVLFAKKKLVVPDLLNIKGVCDIPPPKILLRKEDPICTLQFFNKNREILINKMESSINQIYKKVR